MTNPAYTATRCPRCGASAWGHPTQAIPCQTCHSPVGPIATAASPGVPVAAQAPGAGPRLSLPFALGGGFSRAKVIGTIVLAIVLGVGGVFLKSKLGTTKKGNLSYASLGVDAKQPDGDKLIASLERPARAWKRDAIWWSANFQAVDAQGRIDVSKGAEVVYISEAGVQSQARSVRKDSIKKFNPGSAGVAHDKLWGATEAWKGIESHPKPVCTLKDVMAIVGKTLPPGKTVRVTFDPRFADFYAWRVMSDAPKIDTLYAFSDCSIIK